MPDAKILCKAAFFLGLSLMSLGIALIGLCQSARAETFYVAINDTANVRAERSEASKIIGALDSGTKLDVPMDLCDGFQCVPPGAYRAFSDGSAYGFIRYDLLSLDPPGAYKGVTATVTRNKTILRKGPGQHYDSLGSFDKGTTARLIARLRDGAEEWFKVKVEGKVGWVRGDLLKLEEAIP